MHGDENEPHELYNFSFFLFSFFFFFGKASSNAYIIILHIPIYIALSHEIIDDCSLYQFFFGRKTNYVVKQLIVIYIFLKYITLMFIDIFTKGQQ